MIIGIYWDWSEETNNNQPCHSESPTKEMWPWPMKSNGKKNGTSPTKTGWTDLLWGGYLVAPVMEISIVEQMGNCEFHCGASLKYWAAQLKCSGRHCQSWDNCIWHCTTASRTQKWACTAFRTDILLVQDCVSQEYRTASFCGVSHQVLPFYSYS